MSVDIIALIRSIRRLCEVKAILHILTISILVSWVTSELRAIVILKSDTRILKLFPIRHTRLILILVQGSTNWAVWFLVFTPQQPGLGVESINLIMTVVLLKYVLANVVRVSRVTLPVRSFDAKNGALFLPMSMQASWIILIVKLELTDLLLFEQVLLLINGPTLLLPALTQFPAITHIFPERIGLINATHLYHLLLKTFLIRITTSVQLILNLLIKIIKHHNILLVWVDYLMIANRLLIILAVAIDDLGLTSWSLTKVKVVAFVNTLLIQSTILNSLRRSTNRRVQANLPDHLTSSATAPRRSLFFAKIVWPINNSWLKVAIHTPKFIIFIQNLRRKCLLCSRFNIDIFLLVPRHAWLLKLLSEFVILKRCQIRLWSLIHQIIFLIKLQVILSCLFKMILSNLLLSQLIIELKLS